MAALDGYVVLTLDRLLGTDGTEKLIEVMTDHAIAHQQEGVAHDARGFARSKVRVEIELVTDVMTGHVRAEVAVRGGLAKLRGLVRPMRLASGALLIEGEEDEPAQVRLPDVEDPGRAGRQELVAERRREKALDLPGRRRSSVDEDLDQADPDPDETDPEQDEPKPRLRSIG